ncbi:MAG: hypothetical protein SGARI_007638, partial [Bacillariaceae sp.]
MRILATLLLWAAASRLEAAPASPLPNEYEQPDGSRTPPLYLNGDERYAFLHDEEGYTVMQDDNGWYVYAQSDGEGGLESASVRPGNVNPEKKNLQKYLMHEDAFKDTDPEEDQTRRKLEEMMKFQAPCPNPPCHLKQLALLVRFADHSARQLPSPEDIDTVFNHNGAKQTGAASTGSVSDVYRQNSFDNFGKIL